MTETISGFIRHSRVVQYVNIASVAVLVYDYLITFGDEVELIWKSKLNTGNILFFATRYPAFIDTSFMLVYLFHSNLGTNLCNKFYNASTYSFGVCVIIAGVIMSLRTYALWGRSRYILSTLISVTLLSFVIFIIAYIRSASGSTIWRSTVPEIIPCVLLTTANVNVTFLIFTGLMSLECVIVFLTLWKGVKEWRDNIQPGPLLTIFYRDGLMYFFCLFGTLTKHPSERRLNGSNFPLALSMANFMILLRDSTSGDYYDLLIMMQRVFHSMLSSRIILNLRSVSAETGVNDYWRVPLASIDFASNATETIDSGEMRDFRNTSEMESFQACVRMDRRLTEEMKDSQPGSSSSSSKASSSARSLYPINPLYHAEHDLIHRLHANSPEALQRRIDDDADEHHCSDGRPIATP
ncbi:hypothetical protein DFH11DRAFT_1742730 [Phellopilus nigrolimitatus]|nr:hypothetical protein DFH11DRAFT_1742730 [Phellopilus nigrolimitatus]